MKDDIHSNKRLEMETYDDGNNNRKRNGRDY